MLQSIRDNTQGWIAGVIVSLLIMSFAFWGIHSYLGEGGNDTSVAKVNGVEISKNEFSAAYERLRRQMQMQSNSNNFSSLQAEATLKERALQTLINIQVLTQASLERNYRISTHQIDNFLASMPDFQVNGQFSVAKFQRALEATLYNAPSFLNLIRDSLLIDQPRLGLIFTSFATPNEVNDTIALVNQERDIHFVIIPFQSINKQSIQIPEDKILAFYNQHKEDFKTPEQVSVDYVELSVNDLMPGIHPSEDTLKNYYKDNSASFNPSSKIKTANTKIKPENVNTYDQVSEKVKEAYVRQHAEEKFAELREKLTNISYEHPDSLEETSKTLSLPIRTSALFSKNQGRDDISKNNKIREAAFSNEVLNLKNNSDAIQIANDKAVVIRVKEHSPAAFLPLQSVKNQIIEKLKTAEIESLVAKKANDIKNNLTNNKVAEINQQYHLNWQNVGFIGRHASKVNSAILDVAFRMPKPVNSKSTYGTVKIPEGYAVIALNAVRNGKLDNQSKDQYQVYAEQIQNTQGLMEYELYKQGLLNQAKIVLAN